MLSPQPLWHLFIVSGFFTTAIPPGGRCSFDLHYSNSDVEHLFICLLGICISSLEKFLFISSTHCMTNLDSILKSRDITLPTKVHLVKAMVFQWSCVDVRVGL